jgi:hypothetical protein
VIRTLFFVITSGAVNAAAADGAGFSVDGASATLLYSATPDAWSFNKNVGIGSSSIVTGTRLTLQESGANPTAMALLNRNSTQTWKIAVDATAVDDKILAFIDNATSIVRMALTDTGNLGIGTGASTPGVRLVVSGSGIIVRLGDGTNTFDIRFQGPNNWAQQLNTTNDKFNFQRNSVSLITITSGGNVEIGGSSAAYAGVKLLT